MKQKHIHSFDTLISSYYGSRRSKLRGIRTFDSLLADYYGKALVQKRIPAQQPTTMPLALSYDTNAVSYTHLDVYKRQE